MRRTGDHQPAAPAKMADVPAMPTLIRPMLAIPGQPASDEGWAFEMKWDGVRAVVYVSAATTGT
jgi:bifunctional non-homologous end joining protein LigD